MDLDLRKLRYFVAVAELMHFGRAAERLRVAQPALSRQIRALEEELGAALLVRTTRSVALTPAGRQLLDDAGALLAAAQAAQRRVRRVARGRRALVVGFMPGLVVTPAVRALAAAHPDVHIEVRRIGWDEQAALLLDGQIDVGYLRRPFPDAGLSVLLLASEDRVVVVAEGHRLAAREVVTMAELAGETMIHHDTHPVRNVEEKLELVAAGQGVVLLPATTAGFYQRPDLVRVPVVDAPPAEVCLAHDATRRSPLISEFLRLAVAAQARRRA
ncbi:LysR family transcriptional regulator [Nannocystis punicea]|uniref:LysR substrate-binding domain-containing protein n=1 Tax=Nannocystis punicea TaxID=2995304 RepID=A0ABY7HBT9_9BACT|nr:LysR substrate-binding domain-containing protein [Nannocystis poenicansa]WAS96573.1 LysR substrate-binding domain-containing protein [Nannocystis poenicansa]